jgi:polysaccharide export outer membrane protein
MPKSKPMLSRNWLAALALLPALWLAAPASAQQVAPPDYTLNPGDELDISVWKEPDVTRKVVVRPDGKISFPLAGTLQAVGKSSAQLETEITNKLKPFIPEASVTVVVTGLEGNRVYVIGQVNKPGAQVMNPRLNVLQALALSGGMTPFAGLNEIIVVRGGGTKQQRILPFRYGDVNKGKNLEQNVLLEAGDVVIVP